MYFLPSEQSFVHFNTRSGTCHLNHPIICDEIFLLSSYCTQRKKAHYLLVRSEQQLNADLIIWNETISFFFFNNWIMSWAHFLDYTEGFNYLCKKLLIATTMTCTDEFNPKTVILIFIFLSLYYTEGINVSKNFAAIQNKVSVKEPLWILWDTIDRLL